MKINKATLLATLLLSSSQAPSFASDSEASAVTQSEEIQKVKPTSHLISENWMYITLFAILLVLLVLIGLMLWARKRKNTKG